MISNNNLPVSAAYLPPQDEVFTFLDRIYSTGTVTNNGPLVKELEDRLKDLWGVKHVFLVANGTWALQLAYRALNIHTGVLLTPFSAVPSLSSLKWERIPVSFSDINADTFNLDPKNLPDVTGDVQALCATHVFGNPCEIDTLQAYCRKHGLKLIFDAAHAAGSLWNGNSVLQYGDVSAISFHAFKIFHCIEGGAVVTSDDELAEAIYRMRYFGLDQQMVMKSVGTNAKNSEWHAAMGLANLNYLTHILSERKAASEEFQALLQHPSIRFQHLQPGGHTNFSYFPVVFPNESLLLKSAAVLEQAGFQTKRYFYPALNQLVPGAASMPIAEQIASTILCLPHHHRVSSAHRRQMAELILNQF
jgi:dTDP-4-amino-4,6-dideoxygalactose transaminase